jgi:hypothetical protein
MNRDEFFAKLSPLGQDGLRKVLWNVYWRSPAALRERIEAELDPGERERRRREAAAPADPDLVLGEVSEFAEVARAGAYIAGDRRVSPKERTQWRATFRRLATDAESALRDEDPGPAEAAQALLIDLACETRRLDYFRSEDPVATDLGDRQRRDDQAGPVLPQEPGAAAVIAVGGVERGDQRPRIAQDHADAAPPASSRSS